MAKISDYEKFAGKNAIEDLKIIAGQLNGKVIQNINSTPSGGGVAEILQRMIPLFQELGIDARWDCIKGNSSFFIVTKKIHNALHGRDERITDKMLDTFLEVSQKNIDDIDIYGDIVCIHDPQPIALIKEKIKYKDSKWVWRCHIDISHPDKRIWEFLRQFVHEYNFAVFSSPTFSPELPIRQFLIQPSIDPLSDKNRELSEDEIGEVLKRYNISQDKPILTQVSRFDYLKDPVGVIDAYRGVKKYIDCQLILAGGTASDDPESGEVLSMAQERAGNDPDIHILATNHTDLEINALQRASDIIIQKSLREGFGLTVTEALWKGKPVVASAVGGIALQIKHKYNGLLCRSVEGASFEIKQLLHSPEYARQLGENGREYVRRNFLLTRHMREYMLLFIALYHDHDIIRF